MSLMRYPVYVWSDGVKMHIWARDNAEDDGVRDPVHLGIHGPSEHYPDFISGVSMPLEVWEKIVQQYIEKREYYVDENGKPLPEDW